MKLPQTLALGTLLATSSVSCLDDVNATAPKDNVYQISPEQVEAARRAKCLALFEESASHSQLVDMRDENGGLKWEKRMHTTGPVGISRHDIDAVLRGGKPVAKQILEEEVCSVDCGATRENLRKFDDAIAQIRLNNCGVPDEDIKMVRDSLTGQLDNHCFFEKK
jgi:hypothetical protein